MSNPSGSGRGGKGRGGGKFYKRGRGGARGGSQNRGGNRVGANVMPGFPNVTANITQIPHQNSCGSSGNPFPSPGGFDSAFPPIGADVPPSANAPVGTSKNQHRGRGGGLGRRQNGKNGNQRSINGKQTKEQSSNCSENKSKPDGESDSSDVDNDVSDAPFPRRNKREKKFKGPAFGFKRLYKFLDSPPDDVLISINFEKDEWKEFLESDELEGEKLIVAIQVLGEKVCADVPVLLQQQTNALTACCSKKFVSKLEDVVVKLSVGKSLSNRINPFRNEEYPVDTSPLKVLSDIYRLSSFIFKSMPNNGIDFFQKLIMNSIGASTMCDPSTELFKKFKSLADHIKEITEKEQKKDEAKMRQKPFGLSELNFDAASLASNFREMEVIPTIEDLQQTSEAELHPNKKKGNYENCDYYLNVQFRLLREDFVQPLRKGVRTFLKHRHEYISGKKKMPLGEIRLYTGVTIIKVEKERESVVYKLQLAERNYKKVKWDKSKRLLIGSLIVLTAVENSFKPDNTYFGVVFSRKIPELEKGILTVSWEGSPPVYDEEEVYLMFESEVYLEAYRHTLETLKKLELEKFSMKKFIVEANNCVESPRYLKNAKDLLKLRMADGSEIHLSHEQWQWPSPDEFGLDENQLAAFRAAITKEFTIIQGPPGTGKTFLGLKVAETLLDNSNLWNCGIGSPITVVCYTNHALDQFLEGILKYYHRNNLPAEIIRIGGRCQSVDLTGYTLQNVRKRNRRKLPSHYFAAERGAREDIYDWEDKRSRRMNEVTGLLDLQGIINFDKLSAWRVIQPEYPQVLWNQFQNYNWFGIDDPAMKKENFSEVQVQDTLKDWFSVRKFPKHTSRKRKENEEENVKRTDVTYGEEDEDEENYDPDELMDNRIDVDEVFLEAETSHRINLGQKLSYLPNGSVKGCEEAFKTINKNILLATKGMNQFQTQQYREKHRTSITILDNRMKLLAEIFRLYKKQYLDLPDVKDLLKAIRAGEAVHYDKLRRDERWALYFAVVEQARTLIAENVVEIEKGLAKAQQELRNVIQWGDGLILQNCKVVGLTTTGAAKYNNLLRMMRSKIVIVEEAAEVFEAHIVTCITANCEQLILIGDHRQLRPSPTVYDLAVRYNLDLSLFERMINNKIHCYPLKMQFRMRPDISDLVVDTIYPELFDHESVKLYPDVKGVTKNVFFITHLEKETSGTDSLSKSNLHEANFIAALCRHFILQGYTSDRITVLTMYMGQKFLLDKEVLRTCEGVKIHCVDNFQGEENDIILLSLVRSNSEGKIGFLSIENRVCVALSRAKHGLYIIGNMDMMEKNKTWRGVKEKLENKDFIGNSLELECQIHRTRSKVQCGQDFLKVAPEGGCTVLCDTTLPCSHKCPKVCHVVDKDHKEFKCREPCLKQCENFLHPCKGTCSQQCPRCNVPVERTLGCDLKHKKTMPCYAKVEGYICQVPVKKTLPCGHEETLACHIRVYDYTCKMKVDKKLPCGHNRKLECHVDPKSIRCKIMTPKKLPCGHPQNAECWISEDDVKCETMVPKKILKCGHEMQVRCFEKDKAVVCKGQCTTRLECGHQCRKICHVDDDPKHLTYQCKKDCSRECADKHTCKIKHPCHEECPPCLEPIQRTLPCGHQAELECFLDIRNYDCLEKCQRSLLNCGHTCPNLCFQPCGPCQTKVEKLAPCRHRQKVTCGMLATKEKCDELVRPKQLPQCGHRDTRVPCKYDHLSPEELVQYCTRPCDHVFTKAAGIGCDHKCRGTCSSCFQGRIHMKCQSECGKPLVCGHRCEVPCSALCPPCQKPCLMKCEHSECKKKCGQPCSECKEKCVWVCPHARCTKLCGEMCDREPCKEPCPQKLKCGHDCVGFCGEPCPPLCRQCDNEELTEIFFGTEDEEDARFIYLVDCKHTIEAKGLENFIVIEGSGQIKAKECPKCKTPIRNCRRFGNLIRQFYKDVVTVKMRSFGNIANSNKMRDHWIGVLNQDPPMERVFPQVVTQIRNILFYEVPEKNKTKIIRKEIDEFSMRSLDFITKSAMKVAEELVELRKKDLVSPHYEKVVATYRKTLGAMLKRQPLSRQEVQDFNQELDRTDYFKQLMMRRSRPNCNKHNLKAYPTYETAKKIIVSPMPLNQIRKETFLRLLKELDQLLKSGLGITDRERLDILQAMGMSQGHWFKCPNGHIYAIGDCGGAVMESRCPECNAAIGGAQHRLRADNAIAREMDGDVGPARPTALA